MDRQYIIVVASQYFIFLIYLIKSCDLEHKIKYFAI